MGKRYIFALLAALVLSCNGKTENQDTKKKRPNIVFAILDDASYWHFGAYGCDWVETPNFDKLADQGILFTNAYTPNAKCAPSRSTVLTGRNPWQLEEAANHWCHFPQKFKTYPEVFQENGYHVGYTGKAWGPGIEGTINGKRRELVGKAYNKQKTTPWASGMSVTDYTANFKQFLDENDKEQPFLFWLGIREPHRKYAYGSGIKKGNKKLTDIKTPYATWPQNDTVTTDILDYAYEIDYADHQLGLIIEELKKRNILNNTVVIVTSDNGMPFPRSKGNAYEISNHMPLVVMWPDGIKQTGRKIDDFVSFTDFAPTFLDLAGINAEKSGMQPLEGKSLTKQFYSDKSGTVEKNRDYVLIGRERNDVGRPNDEGYPIRGIVKDGYMLIKNFEPSRWPAGNPETGYMDTDGSPTKTTILDARRVHGKLTHWQQAFGKRPELELYNLKNDPECLVNLADNKELKDLQNTLKEQLYSELKKQSDPRILGNGHIFDEYKFASKKTVNFYERYMGGEKIKTGWINISDYEEAMD